MTVQEEVFSAFLNILMVMEIPEDREEELKEELTSIGKVKRDEAANWAGLEHLYASDNRVKRLPKPEWLDKYGN